MRRIILLVCLWGFIQTGIAQAQPETQEKDTAFSALLERADESVSKRDFEVAMSSLQAAEAYAEKHPELPLAETITIAFLRSELYMSQGKYRASIDEFLQVAKQVESHQLETEISFLPNEPWNSLGTLYKFIGQFDSARICYEKALDQLDFLSESEQQIAQPNLITNIGNIYLNTGELNEALRFYQEALKLRHEQEEVDSLNLAGNLGNIGIVYLRKGDRYKSKDYTERAIQIMEKLLPENSYRLADPYVSLATSYLVLGQYEKANRYYEKVYVLTKDIINTPKKDVYRTLRLNHAYYFQRIKEYAETERLFKEALAFSLEVWGENHPKTAYCYDNLGNHYLYLKNFSAADSCLQKAFNIFNQSAYYSAVKHGQLLKRQGYSLSMQGKNEKAIELFLKADSVFEIASGQYSHYRGEMHETLGVIFAEMGECERANAYFARALNILFQDGISDFSQLAERPSLEIIATLETTKLYAENLQTCYASSPDSLLKAQIILEQHYEMLNKFRNELPEQQDLFSLSERSTSVDHLILDNLFLQHTSASISEAQIMDVFQKIDQNTHISLQRAGNIQSHQSFASLPKDVLELERSIQIEIAYLEKGLENELSEENPDSAKVSRLRDQIFTYQYRADSLQNALQKKYPDYFHLKYDPSKIAFADLQKTLSSDRVLLRYVLGKSNNYLFLISEKAVQLIELPTFELGLIDSLHKATSTPYSTSTAKHLDSLYRSTAFKLYQHLIAPIEEQTGKPLPERLIIIPSGELNYLPFSSLLTEVVPEAALPKDYPYLLKKHAISYAFSATSYNRQVNKKTKAREKSMLAFAPAFDGANFDESAMLTTRLRSHLLPLNFNQTEIEAIGQQIQSKTFSGDQANRNQFLSLAPDHSILHIASHAVLDDSDHRFSYIAFSPDSPDGAPSLLYLADLYGLELNAEMVVLSACNTATGKLLSGEGVASLNQGFAYAGAQSLITTLWSVDDASTAQLMTYFYEGLANDLPKDIALQQAKLRLLESENKPPYFWGAPIAVGDMRPIHQSNWVLPLLTAFFAVLMVVLLLYRRKAK